MTSFKTAETFQICRWKFVKVWSLFKRARRLYDIAHALFNDCVGLSCFLVLLIRALGTVRFELIALISRIAKARPIKSWFERARTETVSVLSGRRSWTNQRYECSALIFGRCLTCIARWSTEPQRVSRRSFKSRIEHLVDTKSLAARPDERLYTKNKWNMNY